MAGDSPVPAAAVGGNSPDAVADRADVLAAPASERSEVRAAPASEQAEVRAVPATDSLVSTTGEPDSSVQTPHTIASLKNTGHRHQADTYTRHTVTPPSTSALVPDVATPQNQEGDSSASISEHSRRDEDIETPSMHEEEDIGIDVNNRSKIHEFLPRLQDVLTSGTSDVNWERFQETLREVTERVKAIVKIRVHHSTVRRLNINPEDPKYIQKVYKRNRRKAIRTILGEDGRRCSIDRQVVENHFKETAARKTCDQTLYENVDAPEERNCIPTSRITPDEVARKLKKCENTAPGDDRITYKHWKTVNPACTALATIFNICMKYESIPDDWKTSVTVLIHKKGDHNDITNWRPIAILRTIYKLFAGVLARRLTAWLESNAVLSPAQKGFLPHDGVFEHNYALRRMFDKARTDKGEFIATWIDFSNAFGSVPRDAIFAGLNRMKAGAKFVNLIKSMYRETKTRILTGNEPTSDICIETGIKQGCPISGLLFNTAIDPIIRNLLGQEANHRVLAYADDLVILAETPEQMQISLDKEERLAGKINKKLILQNHSHCICRGKHQPARESPSSISAINPSGT
jgi:hypothetical protein